MQTLISILNTFSKHEAINKGKRVIIYRKDELG